MRRKSKTLTDSPRTVKIMGSNLESIDQGETAVSVIVKDGETQASINLDVTSTHMLMLRYQNETGQFLQKSFTMKQFLDYLNENDKLKLRLKKKEAKQK